MAENSGIEWTDHSWSPWIGCFKVSPGCAHCYAEEMMTRKSRWAGTWGPAVTTKRLRTSDAYWQEPLRWQRQAEAEGRRLRVFPSLCDPFENNDGLIDWRLDFFQLIRATPNLDWLLLTKRPDVARLFFRLRGDFLLENVRIGTSVENQEWADKRVPELLQISLPNFLSVEPLLGPVNLRWCDWCGRFGPHDCEGGYDWAKTIEEDQAGVDWVIIGGESGKHARKLKLGWVRSLVQQCRAAGAPVFVKQLGSRWKIEAGAKAGKGGDPAEWPEDLQIREFP